MSIKHCLVTSLSRDRFESDFIPFYASLKEIANCNLPVAVIGYGFTEQEIEDLFKSKSIYYIDGLCSYSQIVIDRFVTLAFRTQGVDDIMYHHFDCDIWFNENINSLFDSVDYNRLNCVKDAAVFTFQFDCMPRVEMWRKRFMDKLSFNTKRFGQVLQAGYIGATSLVWNQFSNHMVSLLDSGIIKDQYGADAHALNSFAYDNHNLIQIMSNSFNCIPDFHLTAIEGEFKTHIHANGFLDGEKRIAAIHCGSRRTVGDFEFNFKKFYPELYIKWLQKFGCDTETISNCLINI